MSLRRSGLLALALLAAAGCKDVSQRAPAKKLVVAVFAAPDVPTPNDLALQATPTLPAQVQAQKNLLQSFVHQGGFPADQAPTLSVPIRAYDFDEATQKYAPSATLPSVDPATITKDTAALFKVDELGADQKPVQIPIEAAFNQFPGSVSFVPAKNATGSRRLAPGRYVFAVRGGDSGVKTSDGLPIGTDVPIAFTIPNKDLGNRANQPPGGIPDQNGDGTNADEIAQLQTIQTLLWQKVGWTTANLGAGEIWVPCLGPAAALPQCATVAAAVKSSAYGAIDAAFPHTEVASIAAFQVAAPTVTVPLVDAASGQAPLPIDLLRTGPEGKIAANPAFGAAGKGLVTLDGFSTTAMILAPTSVPVDAGTVNGGTVGIFKLGSGTPLDELKALLGSAQDGHLAAYVAQPSALEIPQGKDILPGSPCPAAGGCSPAIGLQPAVPVGADQAPGGPYFLPPLEENTTYVVVITDGVHDILGNPLGKPTIMTLLGGSDPVALGGRSLVGGVDDATATAIETMRGQVAPYLAGFNGHQVVLAYTFKTQSFKETSLSLAAAPYGIEKTAAKALFTPTAATAVTAPPGIPTTGVAAFYDVAFQSLDVIDKSTGALRSTLKSDLADPAVLATLFIDLHALVAVPAYAATPACPAGFPAGAHCAPLVVFGHGLNGSRETMFAVASSLASRGFLVAAIDFPLHGARNWCSQDSDCTTGSGTGTCTVFPGAEGQGDPKPPGQCSAGSVPVVPADSRYFIGSNFFRTRDAFRQNLLDVGALVLALDRPPVGLPQPAANPFTALLPTGVTADPRLVYYEGLSLGSLAGTSVLAANSRMSRGVLSAGGGTIADFFTNAPNFRPAVTALFTSLLAEPLQGRTFSFDMIDPASPQFDLLVAQDYLQTLNVAKWILDPGEPLNYAVNLEAEPLPDPLASSPALQPAKAIYGQLAQNDPVIPNGFNLELYTLIGATQTFYTGSGAVHGMLALVPDVQDDAAGFLLTPPTTPPPGRDVTLP